MIRKIGDQAHKKITIKDIDGNEEMMEDLMNMNEGWKKHYPFASSFAD